MTQALQSRHATRDELCVPDGQHICLLYDDDEERVWILERFFRGASSSRKRPLYVTDSAPDADVRRWLADIEPTFGEHAAIWTTAAMYYPSGRFDPEPTCARLIDCCRAMTGQHCTGTSCTGEMAWAARGIPGAERLIEYEMMMTDVFEPRPISGICQYDVRRFDGPTLLGILEVHPFMIVRGQLLRNPNYRRRRAGACLGAAS